MMNSAMFFPLLMMMNSHSNDDGGSASFISNKRRALGDGRLLLNGGNYVMNIASDETVRCFYVNQKDYTWVVPDEKFEGDSLNACVQMIVEKYKASELQFVPARVHDNEIVQFLVVITCRKNV